jgi:hypothetical protein
MLSVFHTAEQPAPVLLLINSPADTGRYVPEKHPAHCAYRATEFQRLCDGDVCFLSVRGRPGYVTPANLSHNLEWFNVARRGSRVGSYTWCRNCDHRRFMYVREISRHGSERAWQEAAREKDWVAGGKRLL